jgi:outer membrane lipase/esterase
MSVAAGVDYQISPMWLAGVSASFGRANQSFATGGSFHSDDLAASVYLGFRQEALWMNAVATAGKTNASTSRSVTLGITTETNSASPKGSGQSLALQGGYDFATTLSGLAVTHGPVLGLIAQRAGLDGFTEANGQSGLTALRFASQSRGSTIAELGYQASLDLGGWKLFSKLIWSHELQTSEKTISTSLTTITAPAYALPAAALPKNWATATAGAKYAITDKLSGYVSASLRSGGGGSGGFGASMGFNLAF